MFSLKNFLSLKAYCSNTYVLFLLRFLFLVVILWFVRGHYLVDLWWNSPTESCYEAFSIQGYTKKNDVFCGRSVEHPPFQVAIIGDSMANSFYPGVADAYRKKEMQVVNLGMGTCMPFRGLYGNHPWNKDCDLFNRQIYEYLVNESSIQTVLLVFNRWDVGGMFFDEARTPVLDEHERFLKMRELVQKDITFLVSHGKRVIISFDSPHMTVDPMNCFFGSQCAMASDGGLNAVYTTFWTPIFSNAPNVCVFSIKNTITQNGELPFIKEGHFLFRDDHHLSIYGATFVMQKLRSDPCFQNDLL